MASWELRLDRSLWTPTALGTVGPNGMLRDLAHGSEMSYRPLLRTHLTGTQLADHLDQAIDLVDDSAGWEALVEIPEVAQHCPTLGSWDDRTVAVVVRNWTDHQFQGVLVATCDRTDPEVAYLRTFWVHNAALLTPPRIDDILAGGFLTLFGALARKSAVAVTTSETWSGQRFVRALRDVAGFRPIRELYTEVGLSPADSALVLVDWRATFDDGGLVRFATRPELDEPAHTELLTQLRRRFGHVASQLGDDLAMPTGTRITLKGQVHIDGPHGWGTGRSDDDWYDGPPDVFPDTDEPFNLQAHIRQGPALLARWLGSTGGTRATD